MEDSVLQRMKEWAKSDEAKEFVDKFCHAKEVEKRWIEKFHSLSADERLRIARKIKEKYESDAYLEREYRKCYEPRMELYYFLYQYGLEYGVDSDEGLDDYFPEEKVVIDGIIEVSLMHGQGTLARMHIRDKKRERKEIHFLEDDGSVVLFESCMPIKYTFESTRRSVETGTEVIYTTSMSNMNIRLIDMGYDIFLHKGKESVQIRPKMPELRREIRMAHDIHKIWMEGGFDSAFENKSKGISYEHRECNLFV